MTHPSSHPTRDQAQETLDEEKARRIAALKQKVSVYLGSGGIDIEDDDIRKAHLLFVDSGDETVKKVQSLFGDISLELGELTPAESFYAKSLDSKGLLKVAEAYSLREDYLQAKRVRDRARYMATEEKKDRKPEPYRRRSSHELEDK